MMNFKDLPDELDESFKNQKVILLLNLCAVKLKQRKFKETLLLCNKVRNLYFKINYNELKIKI